MLITKFVVPADEVADVGLQAISMDRLGKFVALTGKNGAGKSRVLAKLNYYIVQRNQTLPNIAGIRERLVNHQNAIATQPESPNLLGWRSGMVQFQQQLMFATERVFSTTTTLGVLPFVPKQLNLIDAKGFNKNQLQQNAEIKGHLGDSLPASVGQARQRPRVIQSCHRQQTTRLRFGWTSRARYRPWPPDHVQGNCYAAKNSSASPV